MRTRYIPGIVMLTAALITSVMCLVRNYETIYSLQILLVVMVIFSIIGFVGKRIVESQVNENKGQEEARFEEERRREMELLFQENENSDEDFTKDENAETDMEVKEKKVEE